VNYSRKENWKKNNSDKDSFDSILENSLVHQTLQDARASLTIPTRP
jgi:hypothetical protein